MGAWCADDTLDPRGARPRACDGGRACVGTPSAIGPHMRPLTLSLSVALLAACAEDAADPSLVVQPTPTVAEGMAWLCRQAQVLSCRGENALCGVEASSIEALASGVCAPLFVDYAACMMRPQRHSCDLLTQGISRACARIFEAYNACGGMGEPPTMTGAYAPAPDAIAPNRLASSALFESETGGPATLFAVAVTVTPDARDATRATLRLESAEPADRLALSCALALRYDSARRYHIADAATTPTCAVEINRQAHVLRWTRAAAFTPFDGVPHIWLEATATGPLLGPAASLALALTPPSTAP